MALEKNMTFLSGVNLPFAYFRVTNVEIDVDSKLAYVTTYVYKDEEARLQEMPIADSTVYAITPDVFDEIFGLDKMDALGDNPFGLAYKYLRTLPEFIDAKDV